jgi:hypothetical protein
VEGLLSLTGKYVGMSLRANLLSTWKRFIISIIDKLLIPDRGITWIRIQARKINHHEDSKQELYKNKGSVYGRDNTKIRL